jgi:CRISPR-associated endonuclease/helicase Cas3
MWQLLRTHLFEVAELAASLAAAFNASALAFVVGYLHDLGKVSDPVQKRIHGTGTKTDHSTAGARELIERWLEYGQNGRALAECLAYCIVGHHAGLPDYGEHDLEPGSLRYRLNPDRAIPDYKKNLHEIALPALQPANVPVKREAFSISLFIRMLFSCLTDADWLNTEAFCDPERAKKRKNDWPAIPVLAEKLAETLIREKWLEKTETSCYPVFDTRSTSSKTECINLARQAILGWCLDVARKEPGIFSLTVPTGGGKTVSSMAFALEHARQNGLRRVILVVPYTSIIEQNAKNLREWLGDDAVLEHHSHYLHPAEREKHTGQDNTDDDQPDAREAQQFRLATENWEATVIVTTAVQFFESLFSDKPSRCRKLHNIANSVVIFDEAQMIPVSLLKPSVLAMKELADHYGTSLLFCTATQPALNRSGNDAFPGFDAGRVTEIVPGDRLKALFDLFRRVKLMYLEKLSDTSLAERLNAEKQVLCIVNTRRRAKEVFEAVRDGTKPEVWLHLSARMTPAHRSKVLEAIQKRLKAGEECRVVSTSLIECGVDISFPAVYREQAGLDSLAQAAGRCNRNGELAEGGRFYIFEPECGLPKNAHDLQRRATLSESVFKRYDDPFSPEAVASYFSQLRRYADTDEFGVVRILCGDSIASKGDFRFNFRSAAKAYRFIDSDMIPVIVVDDVKDNDESARLVERLEKGDSDPLLFRLLQRHTVQIYAWEAGVMERDGALELVKDRFYILRNGTGYNKILGLMVEDPIYMDAEQGLF